jgi:murein DD-endopeptidase MepM/ murein hydrolase activator NlpD
MTPTPSNATDIAYFAHNTLMVPVVGVAPDQVHDTFNESRDNGGRMHRATDILAPRGTPVIAVSAGKILRIGKNALGGLTIYMLDDNARFLYYYAHLDHYSELMAPEKHVARGTILGYVGSTGNADQNVPHLHFQAMRWDPNRRDYWNCAPVDVRPFFQLIGQERDE